MVTDFIWLEDMYKTFLVNAAPRDATWRFLKSKCWTMEDLNNATKSSKELVIALTHFSHSPQIGSYLSSSDVLR